MSTIDPLETGPLDIEALTQLANQLFKESPSSCPGPLLSACVTPIVSPVEIPGNRSFANHFLQCFTGRSPSAVFVLRPGGQQRLLRAASFVSRRAILIALAQ